MPAEKNNLFKDEHTEKRIHEHLRNESDLISEEDIKNVKTTIDEGRPIDSINEKKTVPEKEQGVTNDNTSKDDNESPRIETSWNIIK